MQKKFERNRTKIKGSCQSGRKVVIHDSKSDLPLAECTYKKGPYSRVTSLLACCPSQSSRHIYPDRIGNRCIVLGKHIHIAA